MERNAREKKAKKFILKKNRNAKHHAMENKRTSAREPNWWKIEAKQDEHTTEHGESR